MRLADFDAELERILANPEDMPGVERLRGRSAKAAYRRAYYRELAGLAQRRPVAVTGSMWGGYLVSR